MNTEFTQRNINKINFIYRFIYSRDTTSNLCNNNVAVNFTFFFLKAPYDFPSVM